MSGIAEFFVHQVTVQTKVGTNAKGQPVYGPVSKPVAAFVDDARKLIRGQDGQTVVSDTTVYMGLADGALFVADSLVTNYLTGERIGLVSHTSQNDSGPLGLPDHSVVYIV